MRDEGKEGAEEVSGESPHRHERIVGVLSARVEVRDDLFAELEPLVAHLGRCGLHTGGAHVSGLQLLEVREPRLE